MVRLKYKGNTFIKEINEKLLVRIIKKEYLFEKSQFDYNLLMEILMYFKKSRDISSFMQEQQKKNNEKRAMIHLYLLNKIGSIKEVDEEYIETDENDYLFRNYEDYRSIINKEMLPMFHIENEEILSYVGVGIYLTTYLEENIICMIENREQFTQLAKVIKYKKKRDNISDNVVKLLEYYGKLLSWDYHSKHKRLSPYFVLTKRLEMINYEPFSMDKNQLITDEVSNIQLDEEHQVTASLINYLIQHPSFFLQYNIDKMNDTTYCGNYYFRGYEFAKKVITGNGYLETLSNMLTDILKSHPNFKMNSLDVRNYTYQEGEVLCYHKELYNKAGVLVSVGGY